MTDASAFFEARTRVLSESTVAGGIGTLAEKTLHRILKLTFEPDESKHEVPFLGSVADIYNDHGVTEIQTRALAKLKPKLERFLSVCDVTVIHPIVRKKIIRTLDPATGEISPPRKSPKTGTLFDALYEIYNLTPYFSNPRFHLLLPYLDAEEYRLVVPRDRKNRHGRERLERIPTAYVDEWRFDTARDYLAFLPDALGERFTPTEYGKAVSPRFAHASSGIKVLIAAGVIEREGREGRNVFYRRLPLST